MNTLTKQPAGHPKRLIQRVHLMRAHLVLIVLCILFEKFWWAAARRETGDGFGFADEGTASLSRQFGEWVTALLVGIVEASVVMWVFMLGLLLVRGFNKLLASDK